MKLTNQVAVITNISSLCGLVSPPGQAAYSASKFAVRGFSNQLRHELDGTGIGVTVVHAGAVATSIAERRQSRIWVARTQKSSPSLNGSRRSIIRNS